ncbi:hypothetical protein Hanom_Chr04g00321201 [Helianthus anomalus]
MATCPKHAASPFLSPDVASSDWVHVCLLTVCFPIAINVMGINIRRSQPSLYFFLSDLFQISNFSSSSLHFFPFLFRSSCILTTMSTSS